MHTRQSEPSARPQVSGFRPEDDVERELQAAQVEFVDNPREAVARAERVVDRMLRDLTDRFSALRSRKGDGGGEAETERLRRALQHYRDLAHRLMGVA